MKKQYLIGAFVFRNEGDGCLTSKYINETIREPYTECCKKSSNEQYDVFEGTYETVWIEENNHREEAKLYIERQGNSFELKWTTSTLLFRGRGMIFRNELIGCYWNAELNNDLQHSVQL